MIFHFCAMKMDKNIIKLCNHIGIFENTLSWQEFLAGALLSHRKSFGHSEAQTLQSVRNKVFFRILTITAYNFLWALHPITLAVYFLLDSPTFTFVCDFMNIYRKWNIFQVYAHICFLLILFPFQQKSIPWSAVFYSVLQKSKRKKAPPNDDMHKSECLIVERVRALRLPTFHAAPQTMNSKMKNSYSERANTSGLDEW